MSASASQWCRLLIESLAEAGLRLAVISPGSRSTPLAWAALSSERLACESVIDERSAGFFAVGWAKVTRRPAALVCTSGSAAANYFPAVVEASMSHTPLLVITADRPYELLDCGASQTIDQVKLYGGYARHFIEVGMPDGHPSALAALRRKMAQAVFIATGERPGPVHVNVRARKPLEPSPPRNEEDRAIAAAVDRLLQTPLPGALPPRRTAPPEAVEAVARACGAASRPLVVCGPMSLPPPRDALARFVRLSGAALYCEATSGVRFALPDLEEYAVVDGLDMLLRSASLRRSLRPDFVLQVGGAPTSSRWERFVAEAPDLPRHIVSGDPWPDPHSTARNVLIGDVAATLDALSAQLSSGFAGAAGAGCPTGAAKDAAWRSGLAEANRHAWTLLDAELAGHEFSEAAAVRTVVDALPEGTLLAVGNSLPVRELDEVCRARHTGVAVWAQRGASGIDGLVSGAAGAARAWNGPTALLLGDVSLLHDLSGLGLARAARAPFAIIVLNNDGGRIFEQLPIASMPEATLASLSYWLTPHGIGFASAAALFGVPYNCARSNTALRDGLGEALARSGCTLIEAVVPPHSARELSLRMENALEAMTVDGAL